MSLSFFRRWLGTASAVPAETAEPAIAEDQLETLFHTGLCFACGEGSARDYVQAGRCYEEAAAKGHSLAQFNLAIMYELGQGRASDQVKARAWMLRAAESGDAGAQFRLGTLEDLDNRAGNRRPEQHLDTSEHRVESLKWATLAAAQGYRGAELSCQNIALAMSWDEVAEGQRRAKAFVARPMEGPLAA
jgi:TPR repeat protein